MAAAGELLCSSWTRSHHVDPIGSAGSYSGFLLVDWPLPWPRDVSEIEALTPVASACREAGVRLQAVVPRGETEGRVTMYRWSGEQGRYIGLGAPLGSRPAEMAMRLIGGDTAGTEEVGGTDVLICGHGRRDRCCGSLGTSLALGSAAAQPWGPDVRIRRTSHTGGHRFAPTALVLPEGTCWGYLDEGALADVVARRGSFAEHSFRYRGCTGLGGRAVQALERAVMEKLGWDLLDRPRRGEDADDGRVRLYATDQSGSEQAWEATVRKGRMLPVPTCGQPISGTEKTEAELEVVDLAQIG